MRERALKCEICGKSFYQKQGRGRIAKYCAVCGFEIHSSFYVSPLRYSGRKYKNAPEKLEAIKKKYSGGVTENILSEWIGG